MNSGTSKGDLVCPQEGLRRVCYALRRVWYALRKVSGGSIYIYMIIVQFKQSFNKLFLL